MVICGDGWTHIFYSPRSVNPNNPNMTISQYAGKDSCDQDNFKLSSGKTKLRNTRRYALQKAIIFYIDPRYVCADVGASINTVNSQNSESQVDNTNEINELSGKMECVHVQRIPTNTKIVLIADVDKDGANEMILGLTDRVVRSYRWSSNADLGTGKLVGLNKWECTNQIGTVTLQAC